MICLILGEMCSYELTELIVVGCRVLEILSLIDLRTILLTNDSRFFTLRCC